MGSLNLLVFAQEPGGILGVPTNLYLPFSVLHFLEFAIWGSWIVVLGNYLNALGFSRSAIARIYATMPIGSIISPMILGTIADKYLNTEIVIGISHLAGAVLLVLMARMKRPGTFFAAALAYALVYSPTLALVNSIVFANFDKVNVSSEKFAYIRVFGTIGWIVAGLSLKLLLKPNRPVDNKPLLLAAGLSLALGIFAFFLPSTAPVEADALPFVDALKLITVPTFAVFLLVTLVVAMAMAFYFTFTGLYLEQRQNVQPQNVGPIMTLGQWVEVFFLFSLPWFIAKLGVPTVLFIGVAAWAVRFGFFSYARSFALVLVGVALHGICFDFFFATGFIYMENTAPDAIRASGQALYGVIVYGLGMYLGTEISGWLNQRYTTELAPATEGHPPERKTDWTRFWLIPCVAVAISMLIYLASLVLVKDTPVADAAPADVPAAVEPAA